MAGGTRSRVAHSLAGYAALVRVPNLFTTPPDVLLGAALATATGAAVSSGGLLGLMIASMLLYAAGTTLNDAFDAPTDASERPERPIPSGNVSRRTGFRFGALLLFSGVTTASIAAGVGGGIVAVLIAVGIVLYDGVLKGGLVGFTTMGTIRGLNVLLGATAARLSPTEMSLPSISVVLAVVVYISAVTFMAAKETETGNRHTILVAGFGAVVAGVLAGLRLVSIQPGAIPIVVTLILTIGFLGWVGQALWRAYRNPVPRIIGPTVGTCVLAVVILDAAFAAPVSLVWAFAILVFLIPAIGLKQWFRVS